MIKVSITTSRRHRRCHCHQAIGRRKSPASVAFKPNDGPALTTANDHLLTSANDCFVSANDSLLTLNDARRNDA